MKRYFVYSPDGGFETYSTIEARDAAAAKEIESYLDDGWAEEVTGVCVGEVTGQAMQFNVQEKPKREDFETEEDFDDAVSEWPDMSYDTTCNYEIRPLAQPENGGANNGT